MTDAARPPRRDRDSAEGSAGSDVRLVVPCWNEEKRLDGNAFLSGLEADPALSLTFVDDGSTDGTGDVLRALASKAPDRIELVSLLENRGKGEAVRAGILASFRHSPSFSGWWDADLSTPLSEVSSLRSALSVAPGAWLAMGARLQRLGVRIERRALRHYAGRVVATWISRTLRFPTYDTQCGAKVFRVADTPRGLFDEAFLTRWLFDVEVLARLERLHRRGEGPPPESLAVEVPVSQWIDVPGSKVRPTDFIRAWFGLRRIRRHYELTGPRPSPSAP